MTITTLVNRVHANGDGSTVTFSFPYYVDSESDLEVWLRDADDVETLQTIATHYTVSGALSTAVTVTFVTAPAATEKVTIIRKEPLTNETGIDTINSLRSQGMEKQYDAHARQGERLGELEDRALQMRVTDVIGSGTEAYDLQNRDLVNVPASTIALFKGDQGDSLYQTAVNNGYTGTESEWIDLIIAVPGVLTSASTLAAVAAATYSDIIDLTTPVGWDSIDPTAVKSYATTYPSLADITNNGTIFFKKSDGATVKWGESSPIGLPFPDIDDCVGVDVENGIYFRRDSSNRANNRFISIASAITEGLLTNPATNVYDFPTSTLNGFDDQDFTMFAKSSAVATPSSTQYLLTVSNGANPTSSAIYVDTLNRLNVFVNNSGTQAFINVTNAADSDFTIAARIKTNDFKAYRNGAIHGAADTSGTPPSGMTTVRAGSIATSATASKWTGTIKQFMICKGGQLDAVLTTASAT